MRRSDVEEGCVVLCVCVCGGEEWFGSGRKEWRGVLVEEVEWVINNGDQILNCGSSIMHEMCVRGTGGKTPQKEFLKSRKNTVEWNERLYVLSSRNKRKLFKLVLWPSDVSS